MCSTAYARSLHTSLALCRVDEGEDFCVKFFLVKINSNQSRATKAVIDTHPNVNVASLSTYLHTQNYRTLSTLDLLNQIRQFRITRIYKL